jgi:hypothetical protein
MRNFVGGSAAANRVWVSDQGDATGGSRVIDQNFNLADRAFN